MKADFKDIELYLKKTLPPDCKDFTLDIPEDLNEKNIPTTIYAYKEVHNKTNYSLHSVPLHINWNISSSGKVFKTKLLTITVG